MQQTLALSELPRPFPPRNAKLKNLVENSTEVRGVKTALRWRRKAAMALSAAAMIACGDDDSDPLPAEEQWCREMCHLFSRCQGATPGCDGLCAIDNREYFARSHPDALRLEAHCMATSECSGDLEFVLSDCFLETLDSQPPTDESLEFCEEMSAVFFNCYWFGGPVSCARFFAHGSESALDGALVCSEEACETLEGCLTDHLWETGE